MGSLASHCGKGIQGVQNLQGLSSEIHTYLANLINFTVRCVNVCACISVALFCSKIDILPIKNKNIILAFSVVFNNLKHRKNSPLNLLTFKT